MLLGLLRIHRIEARIVVPESTKWSIPTSIVPKKGVVLRIRVYYSYLSIVIVRDNYHILRTEKFIYDFRKSKSFPNLHESLEYWMVKEEQKEVKPLSTTYHKLYRYIKMGSIWKTFQLHFNASIDLQHVCCRAMWLSYYNVHPCRKLTSAALRSICNACAKVRLDQAPNIKMLSLACTVAHEIMYARTHIYTHACRYLYDFETYNVEMEIEWLERLKDVVFSSKFFQKFGQWKFLENHVWIR